MTTTGTEFRIPLTTENQLRAFVHYAFGVSIPDVQVCPHHTTPWRAFADAYFAKASVSVWKASRGFGGKSYLLALLGLTEAITLKADVNILGGSGEQSENVHTYMRDEFWTHPHAPRHLLASDPAKRATKLVWGNTIKALMASQKSVRGPHPQRLRLDEIDEMDLSIFDAAMGQTMEGDTGIPAQTVASSTHHYADGTMTEVLRRANEKGWPTYEWCISGNCGIMGIDRIIPMREIRKGDRVYAYKDGKLIKTTVTDAWCSGKRRTIIIHTSRGSVHCTPEHRILTKDGWTQAGHLTTGDVVCSVWNPQGDARRLVQDVSLQQQVCRLWQADCKTRDSMPVMCCQMQQQSASTQANRENHLSDMWRPQAVTIQDLPDVLPENNVSKERAKSGRDGVSARAYRTIRQQSQAIQQRRASRRRTINTARPTLSLTGTIRSICSGFRSGRLRYSNRGEWALLAQQACPARPRSAKEEIGGAGGVNVTDIMERPAPSVDFTAVQSIECGAFTLVYDLSVEQGNSFVANGIVVHNCFKETATGWLTQTEIQRKRAEVTTVIWDVEYDLQEPSPESRAIQPDKVTATFDRSLGEYEGSVGERIIVEEPQEGAKYSTGADWAKEQDFTVIITFRTDVRPIRLVAFERTQRLPWPVMVGKYDARLERYGAKGAHDNTGLGDVIADFLQHQATTTDVNMVGRARQDLLSNYIAAIEADDVRAPFIRFMEAEHRLASVDHVYGSKHLPDSIAAGALAWMGTRGGVFVG